MPVDVTLPPGRYYIGDISYSLPEEVYDWWSHTANFSPGLYQYDSGWFAVDDTKYGDGLYQGYEVDAGVIGIVSEALFDYPDAGYGLGTFHDFEQEVRFQSRDGHFAITSGSFRLEIDTDE
jgi:hypothetical protein